jgi:hypothetical protein
MRGLPNFPGTVYLPTVDAPLAMAVSNESKIR